MDEKTKLKKRLIKTIDKLLKRQYYEKLIGRKKRISLQSIYQFLKKIGIKSYLKDDVERLNNKYKQTYFRVKNNKYIKKLQRQYPTLQIVETYTFFVIHDKLKLKKEDVTLFRESLDILFYKVIQKQK